MSNFWGVNTSKTESTDPNAVTAVVKAAPAQAVNTFEVRDSSENVLWYIDSTGTPKPGTGGTGDVTGPSSATDNAITRFNGTTGKVIQNSAVIVDDNGTINIPTGQAYKINGTALAYGDVGAAATSHEHAATAITSATLDGDRLPAITTTKKGGVPATGAPSGKYLKDDGTWATPSGTGDVVGPASSTDNAIVRFDLATGKVIQNSSVTVDDAGSVNIPAAQSYKIDSVALAYGDVGAAASSHVHAGTDITSGSIDGDRLPALSTTKKGGVPATGTPSGLFLKDDNTWATPTGAGDVVGPSGATDNAFARFDTASGKLIQNSLVTADDLGSVNIPTGQSYKINSVALAATDVGAAATSHVHAATDITSAELDGDRLPAVSTTKKGGVPATGTPANKFLRDDNTWQYASGAGSYIFGRADYTVYLSGGVYYAFDVATGTIAYSNANFTTLMGNILGYVIELRSGTYQITSEIDTYGYANTVIRGAGEGNTILMVNGDIIGIHLRSNNCYITDLTIDQTGTDTNAIGIKVGPAVGEAGSAYKCVVQNVEIKNFSGVNGAALFFADQWYYCMFLNVRMMTGNGNVIWFYEESGQAGNNGQTTFMDCETSGTRTSIQRNPRFGTCHRLRFIGCGFQDGQSANYMVDLIGIPDVIFIECDFEYVTTIPAVSMIRTGGFNQIFEGCLFSGKNKAGAVGVTSSGSYSHEGVIFIGCNWDTWAADATAFNSGNPTLVINPATKSFSGTLIGAGATSAVSLFFDDSANIALNSNPLFRGTTGFNASNELAYVNVGDTVHAVGAKYGTGTIIAGSKTAGGGSFGADTIDSIIVEDTTGIVSMNAAGCAIRYVAQATQPTLTHEGEVLLWRDTDDSKLYLIARENSLDKKVELT